MDVQSGGGRKAHNKTPAIVLAVESGQFELALRLIERGANPNDQRNGYSPLHVLSWVRKPKSGDGFDGDPPPRGSGKVNSLAFVRRIVSMGANPNLSIENGKPPGKAQLNMNKYQKSLGFTNHVKVYPSINVLKKYMILDPNTNKWVHFGSIHHEDFLKHKNKDRQRRYFDRFTSLLGKDHESVKYPYSPYNLSLYVLWV
jgi:hypothetical protein